MCSVTNDYQTREILTEIRQAIIDAADARARVLEVWPSGSTDERAHAWQEFEHLTNSSGATSMNVDGSGTAVNFDYTVPLGRFMLLERVNMQVLGGAARALAGFFTTAAALGTGCLVQILAADGTVIEHFGTDVTPITTTVQWNKLAGTDVNSDSAAARSTFAIRWTIAKAGAPAIMTPGQRFRIVIQDDLTDVTTNIEDWEAMVQGILIDDVGLQFRGTGAPD
jgi:hypothetical protein